MAFVSCKVIKKNNVNKTKVFNFERNLVSNFARNCVKKIRKNSLEWSFFIETGLDGSGKDNKS